MSYNLNGAAYGGNRCNTKVTLTYGTTSTLSSTGTITYVIGGRAYTKSALSNTATPTTDANTGLAFPAFPIPTSAADAKGGIIVIGLDASGNVKAAQGPLVNVADVTNGVSAYQFPTLPDTVAPIGAILVTTGATQAAAWTFGTSDNNGVTGVTQTFRDLGGLPVGPWTS